MQDQRSRLPVILLDSRGYSFYHGFQGQSFLPATHYAVGLVTDVAKADQATGAPEIESVATVDGDDGRNGAAYIQAARFLLSHGTQPPRRIIAVTERLMLPAARLRAEFDVPGPSVSQVLLFRDKVLMKQHLGAAGIRVPDFAAFSDAAARTLFLKYPRLIVKPRFGAATQSVFTLRNRADLAAFTAAHTGRLDEFEVEELIDGPLFHLDSVVLEGRVVAATAGRYLDETACYRASMPCRSVAVPDGPLLDELLEFNQKVISCYPGFTGVTHHEVFVTSDGCCLCEIAARAGGAGVAAGFWARTGVNLHQIAVQAQTQDRVPSSIEVARHLTGWVLIHAGPGILAEPIVVPDEPWVVEARILARPGKLLPAPASCSDTVAVVTVRGDTQAEVADRLDAVVDMAAPKVVPG